MVSQFILLVHCRLGWCPSITTASKPNITKELYLRFAKLIEHSGVRFGTEVFGVMINVDLINDGPVISLLESCYPGR